MVTRETEQPCTLNRLCEKKQHHNLSVIYLLTVMKSHHLNVPKFLFRLSLRSANSFSTSARQSLSVLSLWLFSIDRFLNLS